MSYIYKIQREDGLYSAGGGWPRFTKKGKVWTSLVNVKQHLNILNKNTVKYYDDCKLLKFKVKTTEVFCPDLQDVIEMVGKNYGKYI